MSVKSIKSNIRSIEKTRQVTKAMEAVSAAKMRKSQDAALSMRPFAVSAFKMLKRLSKNDDLKSHVLSKTNESSKMLYVIVTSDRGLAGNLNNAVLKAVSRDIAELKLDKTNISFITIGKKGYEYWSKRGYEIVEHYATLGDKPSIEMLREVTDRASNLFIEKKVGGVKLAYSNFKSTFEQEGSVRALLPLDTNALKDVVDGIRPEKGKYADLYIDTDAEIDQSNIYTFEPSPDAVLDSLLAYLANVMLYHTFLEAKASEFSARMVAMKSAGDKALEIKKNLTRVYNKIRQGTITREVSEIIGGIEALKKA